jgi:hypothetical protein
VDGSHDPGFTVARRATEHLRKQLGGHLLTQAANPDEAAASDVLVHYTSALETLFERVHPTLRSSAVLLGGLPR